MSHIAYIALGSNLGNRDETLHAAINKLSQTVGVQVTKVSGVLENPAVGGPENSPSFLNAAAEVQTTLAAKSLLTQLLNIEQSLGRYRQEKWGPRSIDLDLLLYDDLCIESQCLIVPHPLMHQRRFVLQPLAEIAPDLIHPRLNKTVRELLQSILA